MVFRLHGWGFTKLSWYPLYHSSFSPVCQEMPPSAKYRFATSLWFQTAYTRSICLQCALYQYPRLRLWLKMLKIYFTVGCLPLEGAQRRSSTCRWSFREGSCNTLPTFPTLHCCPRNSDLRFKFPRSQNPIEHLGACTLPGGMVEISATCTTRGNYFSFQTSSSVGSGIVRMSFPAWSCWIPIQDNVLITDVFRYLSASIMHHSLRWHCPQRSSNVRLLGVCLSFLYLLPDSSVVHCLGLDPLHSSIVDLQKSHGHIRVS